MGLDALDPSAPRTTSEAINAWLMTSSLCNNTLGSQVKNPDAIKFSKAVIAQLLFTSRTSIMQILHRAIPRSVITIDFFCLISIQTLDWSLLKWRQLASSCKKWHAPNYFDREKESEQTSAKNLGSGVLQYLVVLKSFVRNLDHSFCKTGHTSWKICYLCTTS